jgi:hypothetical protein
VSDFGFHWTPCRGGGGGGGGLAAVILIILIGAAIARPVVDAAEIVVHVLFITGLILAGLTVSAGATCGAVRWHRHRHGITRPARVSLVAPVPPRAVQSRTAPQARPSKIAGSSLEDASGSQPPVSAPRPRELHLHFHGVTEDDLAAITRQLGNREGP